MISYIWGIEKERGKGLEKMLKKGTDEDLRKEKKSGVSHLEITIRAYSWKTFPSIAKEPDETTCVPDLSRCIFHNLCWADKKAVSLGSTVIRMANCTLSLLLCHSSRPRANSPERAILQGVKEWQELCKEDFDSGPLEGQEVSGRLCIFVRHFPMTDKCSVFLSLFIMKRRWTTTVFCWVLMACRLWMSFRITQLYSAHSSDHETLPQHFSNTMQIIWLFLFSSKSTLFSKGKV